MSAVIESDQEVRGNPPQSFRSGLGLHLGEIDSSWHIHQTAALAYTGLLEAARDEWREVGS